MKHLYTHQQFRHSLKERRLCFVDEVRNPNEGLDKQAGDKKNEADKQSIENQNKRKALRAELAKLTAEVGRTSALQKSQKQQEELKSKQTALLVLMRETPQELIKELADELRIPDLDQRLNALASTSEGQEAIKRMVTGLNALNQGTDIQNYTSPEGIMKVARQMVESDVGRRIVELARERGINIQDETLIRSLFIAIRGFAASAFATSRFFNSFPELRERGRQFHYQMAIESRIREMGNSALTLTEIVTRPLAELELLALGPDASAHKAIKDRWNRIYVSWRTVSQNARRTNNTAAVPAVPAIRDAMTDAAASEYLNVINMTPAPQTTPENNQPRVIDALIFSGPAFALEVTPQQTLTTTVNGTRMDFTRDNNGIQVRLGGPAPQGRLLTFRTVNNVNINTLHLVAPNTTAGDIQIRLNGNIAQPGVTLSTLQREATAQANAQRQNINFPTSTTVAFS